MATTRAPDALICARGDRPESVYFVKTGFVSLSAADDETRSPLLLRGPSWLLCTEAIHARPSAYQVRALTRVKLCGLSGDAVRRRLAVDPDSARILLDLLLEENELQHLEDGIHEGDCTRRVARFALAYSRFLEERPDAIPKQVLARMLGMRPETLSRCLTRLERRGAVNASVGLRVVEPRLLESLVVPPET